MSNNIAILLGSFHKNEVDDMLHEVRSYASDNDLQIVDEVWVPGSMEKPLALKRLLSRDDVDGVVVLGIIEKGETKHGVVMASSVIDAIIALQLDYLKPVGVGILGPEILPHQIPSRIKPYAESAVSALHLMLNVE
ncbi:MAG: 6,7-dimethyl-8-ribityllumazine synthase [Gammaproteobacteria bacterium]|nr:6,7-dimethyl-8-ribityllumazine synthase [Gammaproteobacteria bacterium]